MKQTKNNNYDFSTTKIFKNPSLKNIFYLYIPYDPFKLVLVFCQAAKIFLYAAVHKKGKLFFVHWDLVP